MHARPRTSARFLLTLAAMFLLLGAFDLFLTWKLIDGQGNDVFESNPIAARVLEQFGWIGLGAYKLTLLGAIAAVAFGITLRRRRTGEMILVFGCGAQAAVVLTSVFLYRAPDTFELSDSNSEPDIALSEVRSLPTDAMPLLQQRDVQDELELSDEQRKDIAQLAQERREMRAATRFEDLNDVRARFDRLLVKECTFFYELSPKQAKRLRELARQHQGPFAFLEPEVIRSLRLTNAQIRVILELHADAKVATTRARARRVTAGLSNTDEAQLAQFQHQVVSLLTSEQRTRWDEMTGRPFFFPPRAPLTTIADADGSNSR